MSANAEDIPSMAFMGGVEILSVFLRYCLLTVSHFLLHRFLCSVIERICLLC